MKLIDLDLDEFDSDASDSAEQDAGEPDFDYPHPDGKALMEKIPVNRTLIIKILTRMVFVSKMQMTQMRIAMKVREARIF